MPYHCLIAAAAFATLVTSAENAAASGSLSGSLATDLRDDWSLSADNGWARADAHLAVTNSLSAPLAPGLFAHTHLTFEPGNNPTPERGPSLKEAYLQYAADGIAVRGGKLGRKLGISWGAASAPWNAGFIEYYEMSEQIGAAADISVDAGSAGRHMLTTGTFFAGTDVLSRSVLTDDTQAAESDLSSYALALSGEGIAAVPGLTYHMAYVSRDAAPQGRTRETGLTATLTYMLKSLGVQVTPRMEWVSRNDRDAESGTDTARLTTGISFIREGWTVALSRATLETHAANDPEARSGSGQMSLSYALESGIGINAGYSYSERPDLSTEAYGVVIDYAFIF